MSPQEVQERLKLNQLKDKIWYVVPSCATTGEGLLEGLVSAEISSRALTMVANNASGLAFQQRQDATTTTTQIALFFAAIPISLPRPPTILLYTTEFSALGGIDGFLWPLAIISQIPVPCRFDCSQLDCPLLFDLPTKTRISFCNTISILAVREG